ncbi:(5-formylfuran-3-yl)methyl phosphate synthase [Bythopirellula goksoeyrii]|uniref:(5-formylfuran-3-yl)methyl phosphate synthase n=1 Tax=Bythopirellula goksoeyrii TaxID=1400387 RepID=A0A5B9QC89_9BACT|nr:(5-formylfuran-3-yl)methyl phosphate synthase [Bythopirellula goksoeyrii]QEG36667.1 hypothetical protein Pr1d_39820 [Bythopirellula goksoeyrii]
MNHIQSLESPANALLHHGSHSPKLLVSVRDVSEIEDAIAGGADWIDFKEPHDGPLGAVSSNQACQMVRVVDSRLPVSAALGELIDWQSAPSQQLLKIPGIDVVKLGLAGCASLRNWESTWQDLYQQAADHGKQMAAVAYADWSRAEAPSPDAVLEAAIKTGASYLLIDTWDKRSRSTLDCFNPEELAGLVKHVRSSEIRTVLAGNLRLADISSAVELETDILAVRGAACRGDRTDTINYQAVRAIKRAIVSAR